MIFTYYGVLFANAYRVLYLLKTDSSVKQCKLFLGEAGLV